MGLRAGLLREIVTFQRAEITRDAFGEQSTTWHDVLTTNARVVYGGGSRTERNNEVYNTFTVSIIVRSYHNINEQMRILFDGRYYSILSINREQHNQQITIIASVINE